jgi:hypothetical protein
MSRTARFFAAGLAVFAFAPVPPLFGQVRVASPDGRNRVTVELHDGRLYYSLARDGRDLMLPSLLGFSFRGAPELRDSLRITDTTRQSHDEWWTQPWGEVARVRDHHNELSVSVEETAAPRRRFILRVRAFDDGIGFRYELPEQPGLGAFEISRRADRVRPGRQRPRLVDRVQLAAEGPVRGALLVGTGQHAGQRADAAHHGDARTAAPSW